MPKRSYKKNKEALYLIIPAFLLGLLFILTVINIDLKLQIDKNSTNNIDLSFSPQDYPVFETTDNISLTARGVTIMDSKSKKVLFEKGGNIRFSPASTSKILTAYVAMNHFKQDDLLEIKNADIYSVAGLAKGEKYKFEDLLYALMLPSDNLAAYAIADNYPGGRTAFSQAVNRELLKNRILNSKFVDPAGLADDVNYTTPKDLALISSLAMQNSVIRQIVSHKKKTIYSDNGRKIDLENLNILLGLDGVIGLKTGHTDQAGDVLVTAKEEEIGKEKRLIIFVVMQSENRFSDTIKLLEFVRNKVNYLSIHP